MKLKAFSLVLSGAFILFSVLLIVDYFFGKSEQILVVKSVSVDTTSHPRYSSSKTYYIHSNAGDLNVDESLYSSVYLGDSLLLLRTGLFGFNYELYTLPDHKPRRLYNSIYHFFPLLPLLLVLPFFLHLSKRDEVFFMVARPLSLLLALVILLMSFWY